MSGYAELATATNFSFLRGASHANELVARARQLGHCGIGIADRNTVAGVVRAHTALRQAHEDLAEKRDDAPIPDFKLATGTRFCFFDDTPDIIAYPENRIGWGRICRLLTDGNRRTKKGACELYLEDLLADASGLLLIVMPPARLKELPKQLSLLDKAAPGSLWLGATMLRRGDDDRRLAELKAIARTTRVPLIAVNDVLYHAPERRPLQDLVTCIREGVTIQTAGRRLEANAERHLKSPEEMLHLFRDAPGAVAESIHLLARIDFDLKDLVYDYPDEPIPPGKTPQSYLEHLVWSRALWRYGIHLPSHVYRSIVDELAFIRKRKFARYFLTIYQIIQFAENVGILCQGRGSAANSVVCFTLGITCVNPEEARLLFARFLSERSDGTIEPPDIDVDFEHERREEVIQHIYEKYGRDRAGIAATVIHYRSRSAIRDVGKAMGLTEDVTAALANNTAWWDRGYSEQHMREAGLDPADARLNRARDLAIELTGFPRHLSQHVGGFILTRDRLDELVPIGNAAMDDRTFIEWDRNDIDELRLLKVDVLALGMLTCIRLCFDLLNRHKKKEEGEWRLDAIPSGKTEVYDMLCNGDSIGVFQVESRAQINMLPRLKPREFYDLVIEVAIVRPGPIQGDMVHPYLRRRNKVEKVIYPSPAPEHGPANELEEILCRTLGVSLFQEQAMEIAIVAARFTPDEANGLRRAMATFRSLGTIGKYKDKFIVGMVSRGYTLNDAERHFKQIEGFGDYGFPESHAASFAKLVYISSWLKLFHPEIFTCALLNAQPMGFYAPAQLVRDLREHGRIVAPIDVAYSDWDNVLERVVEENDALALRLGFRQLDGFREEWARRIVEMRGSGFPSIEVLMRRATLPRAALEKLAEADAFRSMELDRREALWIVRSLPDAKPLPLFDAARANELAAETETLLPVMPLSEHVVADYRMTRLSLKAHPMSFLREQFAAEGVVNCTAIAALPDGRRARTAGVVLIRQRPGKGNAIFMTLEDETGIVNVVIWARIIERFRKAIVGSRLIMVEGIVQKSPENVIHLMADRLTDRSDRLATLSDSGPLRPRLSQAGEFSAPSPPRHPRNVRILPKSRDFH